MVGNAVVVAKSACARVLVEFQLELDMRVQAIADAKRVSKLDQAASAAANTIISAAPQVLLHALLFARVGHKHHSNLCCTAAPTALVRHTEACMQHLLLRLQGA